MKAPERGAFLFLLLLVAAAGCIRFYGLDFGLPDFYHPDETVKARVVLGMMKRAELDPKYFRHPSLLLYSTLGMTRLLERSGFGIADRELAVFAGRMVSAFAGTLSVFVLYLIGAMLWDKKSGLAAAALLAFCPLHVTCSRYFKEDALLVFFLVTALALIIHASRERRGYGSRERGEDILYIAGAVLGLAVGTKYSGLLGVVMLVAAPIFFRRLLIRDVLVACGFVPIFFVLACPYAVISYDSWLAGLLSEKSHIMYGHSMIIRPSDAYWTYHLRRSLVPGIGVVPLLAAALGSAIILLRRKPAELFVLFLVLLFYLPAEAIPAKPFPQPERYVLPVIPILCLTFAALVHWLTTAQLAVTRSLGGLVIALTIIFPAKRSIALASDIRDDTRARMERWAGANLPRQSSVLLDGSYSPRLEDYSFKTKVIRAEGNSWLLSLNRLRKSGHQYFLTTSFAYDRYISEQFAPKHVRDVYRKIFANFRLVHEEHAKSGTYGFHNPTVRLYAVE